MTLTKGWGVATDATSGGGPPRATMSMREAAAYVGVSMDSVRKWIDSYEPPNAGPPVAACERDSEGRRIGLSWRRPFVDAVHDWARSREGRTHEPGS